MFRLIEIWDVLAYVIYDFFAVIKFVLVDWFKYRKILKKNKELKNKHAGGRCFIVLNGPSIKDYDLKKISDEITICSNYFYLSEYFDVIKPDYYCICDSDTFIDDRIQRVHELLSKEGNMKYIFNKRALNKLSEEEKKKCYFVYGMHMPHLFKVRDNLSGISSSFTNVSMFCILCAMYMGFKDIYILGNDFAPGAGLTHCYGNVDVEREVNEVYRKKNRVNLCTFYWSYYLAHIQSFYLEKHARKKGVNIFNLNKESYVRAYDFKEYDEVIKGENNGE